MRAIAHVVILAVVLTTAPARADDASSATEACLGAFERAQLRRSEGDPIGARTDLEICAAELCPEVVRRKCRAWRPDVEAEIPRIVIAGVDGESTITDAQVFLDDELVADWLGGTSIAVAPGRHRLRLLHPDGRVVEQEVVLMPGARRLVTLVLPGREPIARPLPPDPVSGPERLAEPLNPSLESTSLWPLVGVGYGLAGAALVAGAVTGVMALDRGDDLEARCAAPGPEACTQAEIDEGLALAHASTASLALAGAGLLAGSVALALSLGGNERVAFVKPSGTLIGLGIRWHP